MQTPRVAIIGAGISGLTLGWKLAEAGADVEIFESSSFSGGLAGTVREDGYSLDIGPHSFFTEDPEVLRLVLALFPEQEPLQAKPRRVKLRFRGRWLDYPFTASSVLIQMGVRSSIAVLRDLLTSRVLPRSGSGSGQSVEDWALAHFGRHLYESFFKPYTEQFWKIPCRELSSRSIPTHTQLSFSNALRAIVQKTFSRDSATQIERERLPTYYPKTGYGEIAEKIAARFKAAGGRLNLECRVRSVEKNAAGKIRVHFSKSGGNAEAESDVLVSTLPLPLFAAMIQPSLSEEILESAARLEFRPFLMLGMALKRRDILSADYVYTLDRPYNRLTEFTKFSEGLSPAGENILAAEIPCRKGPGLWNASREDLFELCLPSLEADGLLKRGDVTRLFMIKAPSAYPVYRLGYEKHLRKVLGAVESLGLFTLGRGGEFHYMDADQCIRRALDLVPAVLEAARKESSGVSPEVTA